ncbi:hypothetical protein EQO05_02720 [Methanosarcina sp. MSH10X1]|uniref:hypothetical protein n=1 Tax=Methanosarcina sp. MSH10X1 TaxID=2507075 RepID=UPI000FFCA8A3|nr:hypothetical protein [Methanosarcina sp. MSH10X1]RXA21353.1 hypothetical protein EQO05_02720 [Methanosarcina sp. MSH10X1]
MRKLLFRDRCAATVAPVDHADSDVFDKSGFLIKLFLKKFSLKPFLKRLAVKDFLKRLAVKDFLKKFVVMH